MDVLGWSLLPAEVGNVCLFLVLGSLSAMMVSMAKAGFGGSIGILSFPVMVYACQGDALLASGTTLPLLIACDLVALVSWWRKWSFRTIWPLFPGTLGGVLAGWAILWWLRNIGGGQADAAEAATQKANAVLIVIVGLIALGFVVIQAVGSWSSHPPAFRPALWQGTAAGAAAGAASTLAHAAGPIVTMYLLPQQMPKGAFVASTVLYYAVFNQVKLIPYFALGLINYRTAGASVALLPAVIAGTLLGLVLHSRVVQRQFTAVVYVLLTLTGVHMCYSGLAKLLALAGG
jgi:hypothetical protein